MGFLVSQKSFLLITPLKDANSLKDQVSVFPTIYKDEEYYRIHSVVKFPMPHLSAYRISHVLLLLHQLFHVNAENMALRERAKVDMDEEMILLDNVMPVEIALKRELAYRRKVEALRKQQQSDSNNDTSHLEGPLLSLPGTKRKAPSTSSQGISSLLPSGSPQTFQKTTRRPSLHGLQGDLLHSILRQAALCKSNTQRQIITDEKMGYTFKQPSIV
ncbi:hypothetical protein Acr_13g0016150 [Actinidia rufa]|uniref:Uncharacterized protein n=1 Tax=Actinidia rufa TaxID=165716 RepID=A0A7J0FNC8_9ERIC|nr:hypothetical protein Acr_13g0016150 [Actinidia rufa]